MREPVLETLKWAAPVAPRARLTPSTIGTGPPVSPAAHVERNGEQAAAERVHEVTGRHIARIASAFNECLSFSRRHRLHDDVRFVPSVSGCRSRA